MSVRSNLSFTKIAIESLVRLKYNNVVNETRGKGQRLHVDEIGKQQPLSSSVPYIYTYISLSFSRSVFRIRSRG